MQSQQLHLQNQIHEILQENNRVNSKLEEIKLATTHNSPKTTRLGCESRDDATREKFTHQALYNLKEQIKYLQTENNDLRTLNKTFENTIANLENEIQNYRAQVYNQSSSCEIKHKYETTIKLLESTIKHKNLELKELSLNMESFFEQKKQLTDRIEKAEKLLEEKSTELENFSETNETMSKLEKQLSEAEQHNKELQNSLKLSQQAMEKRLKREKNAMQKVQEALSIAEAAEVEKQEALKRERVVKDECDNIASTIGQVMDEAARKVESDMEAIKIKYAEKEKILNEKNSKLDQEIQNQKNFIQVLDARCKRYEQKYKEVVTENNKLSDQLGHAAKAMWDLKEKVKKLEHQSNEEFLQKSSMDQDNKIQQFVKNNRLLRERYKAALNDITEKFGMQIHSLQEEITRLKAENEAVKLQKNYR